MPEAPVKFFNPNSSRKQLVEKVPKWRGDHSQCGGHRDGECIAPFAWKVMDKTWELRADMAGVSIEPNMLGTVLTGEKGAYPQPVWKAKGWLEPKDADGVRPSADVVRFHIDRLVQERRVTLEHKKAEFAFIERDTKALREAAEKANAALLKARD